MYKSVLGIVVMGFVLFLASSCASQRKPSYKTQEPPNYSITAGDIEPVVEDKTPKGAIELRGLILTDGKKLKDRYIYDFKLLEIVSFGSTYTSAVPKLQEVVELITPGIQFEKDSEVVVYVLVPMSKPEGKMTLNMIVK